MLNQRSYDVVVTADGTEAWEVLQGNDPPRLALLDWLMSEMDGVDVCRRVREDPRLKGTYMILLTARADKTHIVEGLQAGANDYVTKPFDWEELLARVNVGVQMVQLQDELAARVHELEGALAQVKQLQGLLPFCAFCKRIRDDQNYWKEVDVYIREHSKAECSGAVCPKCWESVVRPEFLEKGIALPEECPG
jgi:PleD family two-component response regulator